MSDLISRSAFKNYLEEIRQDYLEEDTMSSDFAANVIETVQDKYLEDFPTVDAVPVVHGRWVHDGQRIHNGVDWWHCSECNTPATGVEIKYNFCHNCGADMRERKDTTD